jgi:hypothetical protein
MHEKNYLILDNEFISYCKLNNINDTDKFAKEIFNKGFNIVKYGETPKGFSIQKISEVPKETSINDFSNEINKLREENLILNQKLKSLVENSEKTKINKDRTSIYDE